MIMKHITETRLIEHAVGYFDEVALGTSICISRKEKTPVFLISLKEYESLLNLREFGLMENRNNVKAEE